MELSEEQIKNGDFKPEDLMLDDEFYEDLEDDDEEEDDEDEDNPGFDYESYLLGLELPKHKFIGKSKREYLIRIKLNNSPVSIWRELVVPSNITLELLAFVLLDAMGWKHEHLYQFIGKNNVCYVNSRELKENANSFMAFMSRVQKKNSEKTSLEMVLQPKGERMKFEYDYGDSWTHDLWVKSSRDYAPNEEPVIKLLKAQGECPPEDCGGVWGYANLLELNKKKRKTAEDKERLEWYDIPNGFDPEACDLEWLQDDVEGLWMKIQEEM
ncbi:MAG: plasmid pRiA4b ORF-3 family protein [Prevotella sp.]|nr:plasmid pRiA4b ORF-3 family protein [Prevotella sp.]